MPSIKITPADKWFSKCVRESSGWKCERCGAQHSESSTGLHCAHWMSRGSWGTRFIPDNCAALCYGCHSYVDSHPYEKNEFFEKRLGEGLAQLIREKAKTPAYGIKKFQKEIAAHYRGEFARLRAMRENGETGKLGVISYL